MGLNTPGQARRPVLLDWNDQQAHLPGEPFGPGIASSGTQRPPRRFHFPATAAGASTTAGASSRVKLRAPNVPISRTPSGPKLRLPHDWAIEGPFDSRRSIPTPEPCPSSGPGWYRKWFTLPATAKDRYFTIEFDGAMSNAHVWLNGHELGGRPYGYIGFAFDLTPHLRFGSGENVLVVRLTPGGALLPLVPRRRHLPQRVARCHRTGARRTLGNLRDHARGHRRTGHRHCEDRTPQPAGPRSPRHPPDLHSRCLRQESRQHDRPGHHSRHRYPTPSTST